MVFGSAIGPVLWGKLWEFFCNETCDVVPVLNSTNVTLPTPTPLEPEPFAPAPEVEGNMGPHDAFFYVFMGTAVWSALCGFLTVFARKAKPPNGGGGSRDDKVVLLEDVEGDSVSDEELSMFEGEDTLLDHLRGEKGESEPIELDSDSDLSL